MMRMIESIFEDINIITNDSLVYPIYIRMFIQSHLIIPVNSPKVCPRAILDVTFSDQFSINLNELLMGQSLTVIKRRSVVIDMHSIR